MGSGSPWSPLAAVALAVTAAAAAAAALAGCEGPIDPTQCAVRCGSDRSCPSDMSCGTDDYCHSPGEALDCSPDAALLPTPDAAPAPDVRIAPPDAPPPIDARPDARPCTGGDVTLMDPTTGHCYMIFNGTRNWQSASDYCVSQDAHLVTISSSAELQIVRPSTGFRWIGLEDIGSEGFFQWVTGEPMTYTNWNGGEPNGGGGENCGGILSSGKWNDFQCSDSWAFVCEFP